MERLADDLVGRIALQPRGAGIPAHDAAVEVEHVDGVVDDRIDQQLKAAGVSDLRQARPVLHGAPFPLVSAGRNGRSGRHLVRQPIQPVIDDHLSPQPLQTRFCGNRSKALARPAKSRSIRPPAQSRAFSDVTADR